MQPPRSNPSRAALPKNAKTLSQFTLDQLKKTAASRGIPVEKLVAQMVQQYLREGRKL